MVKACAVTVCVMSDYYYSLGIVWRIMYIILLVFIWDRQYYLLVFLLGNLLVMFSSFLSTVVHLLDRDPGVSLINTIS